MTTLAKRKIIESLHDLPEKTTIEAAIERLYLIAKKHTKINKGVTYVFR